MLISKTKNIISILIFGTVIISIIKTVFPFYVDGIKVVYQRTTDLDFILYDISDSLIIKSKMIKFNVKPKKLNYNQFEIQNDLDSFVDFTNHEKQYIIIGKITGINKSFIPLLKIERIISIFDYRLYWYSLFIFTFLLIILIVPQLNNYSKP